MPVTVTVTVTLTAHHVSLPSLPSQGDQDQGPKVVLADSSTWRELTLIVLL